MSVDVEILPEERFHIAVYVGTVTPADVERHWQTLRSAPSYEFDYDEVIAYRTGADLSAFTFEFAKSEAERFLEAHDVLPMKSCLVCSDPKIVPIARLYLAYIQANGPKHIEFDHFLDTQSAIHWINAGRAAGQERKPIDEEAVKRALAKLQAESLWPARGHPDAGSVP